MRAIECDTEIDENGQVTLPEKYRTAYGKRAHLVILLQDETEPMNRRRHPGSAKGKLTILSEDDDHLKEFKE